MCIVRLQSRAFTVLAVGYGRDALSSHSWLNRNNRWHACRQEVIDPKGCFDGVNQLQSKPKWLVTFSLNRSATFVFSYCIIIVRTMWCQTTKVQVKVEVRSDGTLAVSIVKIFLQYGKCWVEFFVDFLLSWCEVLNYCFLTSFSWTFHCTLMLGKLICFLGVGDLLSCVLRMSTEEYQQWPRKPTSPLLKH